MIIKEAEKILKYKKSYNRNTAHVECKNKGDTSNNRGDWNCFKVIQKIREQHTGENMKSRNSRKQPHWARHTYCGKY